MSFNINQDVLVQAGRGIWTPPATVTDHLWGKLAPECDFFVAPPPEIGEIKSAYTSLKKGVDARPVPTRLAIAAGVAAAGCIAALALNSLTHLLLVVASLTHTSIPLWAAILGCLAGLIAWNAAGFKHFCNFAGVEGCAEFRCKGVRENITRKRVFRFADAWAVWILTVRHYKGGRYTYTNYFFHWYPPESEKAIYKITGSFSAKKGNPPVGNLYNFARAVDGAWTAYLRPKLDFELAQSGYVKFQMLHKRWMHVGPGVLEIVDKNGNVSRCEAGNIASAKLDFNSGIITLQRKDPASNFFGLPESTGTYQIKYGDLYNAHLFLFAFEKFVGIRISG